MVDDSDRNTSSDSTDPSSDGNTNKNRSFRLQVEANLAQRFIKAMEIRMKQLEVTNAQDFKLSQHERKVLMDVVTANLLEGAVAGAITFFVLRRLHVEYFKYIKRGYADPTATFRRPTMPNAFNSPYQQIPVTPTQPTITNMTNAMQNSTGSNSGRFGSTRWIVYATSLIFDGIVSMYVALFVSTRNPDKFLEQVSDLPLMEGESVISRELCPILLNELQKIHADLAHGSRDMNSPTLPKISDKNKVIVRDAIAHPQTPVLQCLMNFCTNCRRRAAYEQLLREQSGSNDAVISIPPPGVPPTFDIANDITLSATDENPLSTLTTTEDLFNDSNFDDDITTGTTDSDWTEPFVTDQEDDRRK